jgi:hypothetical protein
MKDRRTSRRLWIVLALALPLTVAFAGGALQAQPGQPRPGPSPGKPGFPNFGGQPGQPGLPNPGGQPGNPNNPGRPGGLPGGALQVGWKCPKCGQTGTGSMIPPPNCPCCGVRFINGVGGGPNPNPNPAGMPKQGGMPNPNPPGGAANAGGNLDSGGATTPPANVNKDAAAKDAKDGGIGTAAVIAILGAGVVTLLLLAGVIGLVVWLVMASNKSGKRQKRSKRDRKAFDDEQGLPRKKEGITVTDR